MRVDADAIAARRLPRGDRARRGREAGARIFGVDPALDDVAGHRDRLLRPRERPAGGDLDLRDHEILAGALLADGVLDLQAAVELHEAQHAAGGIWIQEQLHRAGTDVADSCSRACGRSAGGGAQIVIDRGRRALLDQLLMVALHGAVALAEVHGVAVLVGEDLDLDVAPVLDQALEEHAIAAERSASLRLRLGVRGLDLIGRARDPHAAAAAAVLRLEQHGEPDLGRDAFRVLHSGEDPERARDHAHAGRAHRGLRTGLRAHQRRDVWRRADERHAMLRAQRGEQRILRQEAPAGMQGRAVRLHGGLHHALDIEVALRGAAGAEHHDLATARVRRLAIGFADPEHRHDAERVTGARDPHGDLAAVGDQDAMEQRRRHAADANTISSDRGGTPRRSTRRTCRGLPSRSS